MPSDSRPGQLLDDERTVLDLLLAGDHPVLETLRAQAAGAEVVSRLEGGQLRHVRLEIAPDMPLCDLEVAELGDVRVEFNDSSAVGIACVLVLDGALNSLEISCTEGTVRPGARVAGAGYFANRFGDGDPAALPWMEALAERDLAQVEAALAPEEEDGEAVSDAAQALEVIADLVPRPEDSVTLPLVAPLMELIRRLVPEDELDEPELLDPDPVTRAGQIGLNVILALQFIVGDTAVTEEVGLADLDLPMASKVRCYKAWLKQSKPEPVMAALMAARLTDSLEGGILDPRSRPLARLLFHHVRAEGIADWVTAYRHAAEWWGRPSGRDQVWELVLASVAHDRDAESHESREIRAHVLALMGQKLAGDEERPEAQVPPAEPASMPEPSGNVSAGRDDEVERLTFRLQETARELDELRRKKKLLAEQLSELREKLARAEAECEQHRRLSRAFHRQLLEARDAEEAGDHSIEPPPDEGWPDDLLAGYTIVLFTGQQRAAAREAMAEALRDVGAIVTVEECNSKGSVPDRFQDGVVVVTDVRFTGHAASDRIRAAADRSGVKLIEVKAGEGGIVRAVAGKLGAGRQLGGWSDGD